jgi:hypothetical protein
MLRFRGSLDDLQDIVLQCAVPGEWCFHEKSRFYRFHAATGAILNWWPSTGTINFQGRDAEQLEELLRSHEFGDTSVGAVTILSDEAVWAPVPGATPPPDERHEIQGSTMTERRRKLTSQRSRP